MMYIACLALIVMLGRYLNSLRVGNETLRLKNQFTRLNSRLYLLAENNVVSFDDKHFRFLQRALSSAEVVLPQINFWILAYKAFKTRKDSNQSNYLEFEKEFQHPELRRILNQYTRYSYKYFFSKNFFAFRTFSFGLSAIVLFTTAFNKARGITFRQNFRRNFKFFLIKKEEEYSTHVVYHHPRNKPLIPGVLRARPPKD